MNAINLDAFQEVEVDLDLRRCTASQAAALLDIVQLDRFLDYIYTTLLRRDPDREGRLHYRKLVREGLTRPAIVQRLLRSREYKASSVEAAGLSAEEFVRRAYKDILGRSPDQDGLATYRRIAARRNGHRKVLSNLSASGEAVRKNGGRLARIEALRRYAAESWPTRLPGVGRWFAERRRLRQRIDRMALNQHLLAQEISSLRNEIGATAEPFGFVDDMDRAGRTPGGDRSAAIFFNALARARREA